VLRRQGAAKHKLRYGGQAAELR